MPYNYTPHQLTDDYSSHLTFARCYGRIVPYRSLPLLLDDAGLHVLDISLPELCVEHELHGDGIDMNHLSSRGDAGRELFCQRVEKPFVNFIGVHKWYLDADLADEIMLLGAAEVECFVFILHLAGEICDIRDVGHRRGRTRRAWWFRACSRCCVPTILARAKVY